VYHQEDPEVLTMSDLTHEICMNEQRHTFLGCCQSATLFIRLLETVMSITLLIRQWSVEFSEQANADSPS
jgi:hypothetical protein